MHLLNRNWFIGLMCALAGFVAYLPVVGAKFVWDDNTVQVMQVPYLKTLKDVFVPSTNMAGSSIYYFRPLVTLSYMAEEKANNALHGTADTEEARRNPRRARIPHTVTLLIHALTACAVALLARRCLAGRGGALWGTWAAGLAFALHPIHTETVATIAGRSDSMAALFLLAALLAALHGRDRGSLPAYGGAALLFLCALLSKEVAAAGILLLPLCLWMVPDEKGGSVKNTWPGLAAFAAGAAVYAGLHLNSGRALGALRMSSLGETAADVLKAAGFYVKKLFLPLPLLPYIPEMPGLPETIAALAFFVLLAALAVWLWRRGDKFYLFCLLWFGLTISPSLYLVGRSVAATYLAERYLYLPSVSFALALGGLAAWGSTLRRRVYAFAAAGVLLAAYAVASFASTGLWRDDRALWSGVVAQPMGARHGLPWANLGIENYLVGNLEEAERCFLRVFAEGVTADVPAQSAAYNGMGLVHFSRAMTAFGAQRMMEAQSLFQAAAQNFSYAVDTHMPNWMFRKNLGQTQLLLANVGYSRTKQYDLPLVEKAKQNLTSALRMCPGNGEIVDLLNRSNAILGRQ